MAGTLTIDTLKASSGVLATQNGMTGIAKAWVNFNGVTTTTINGSFNVSSVVRNGTGDYTVNFTTAMPSANYSSNGLAQRGDFANGDFGVVPYGTSNNTMYQTASAFRCLTRIGSLATLTDSPCVTLSFFSA